jgi:hypothetical protein
MGDDRTRVRTHYTGAGGLATVEDGDTRVVVAHGYPADEGRVGPPPGAVGEALADGADALVLTGVPDTRDLWPDAPEGAVPVPNVERADRVVVSGPVDAGEGAPGDPAEWLAPGADVERTVLPAGDRLRVAGETGAVTLRSLGRGRETASTVRSRPVVAAGSGGRVLFGGPRERDGADPDRPVDLAVVTDGHAAPAGAVVHAVATRSVAEYREDREFRPEWATAASDAPAVVCEAVAGSAAYDLADGTVTGATELPQPQDDLRETAAVLRRDPRATTVDHDSVLRLATPEPVPPVGAAETTLDAVCGRVGVGVERAGVDADPAEFYRTCRTGAGLVADLRARVDDLLGGGDDPELGRE